MSSYASRKEGQLCPNKSCIQIVHAREKAEDAEAAAALRELEKALTSYQDAEAEVAQGGLEKALRGYQEVEAPAAEAALRELEKALTNYQSAEAAATRRSVSCCWPLRSCRHRKRWTARPHK